MDLKEIIKSVYPIGAVMVPGFSALLPLGLALSMVDAVSVGLEHDVKVDMKLWDIAGLLKVMMEVAQAGLQPTQREQAEAVYYLMAYITNVEDTVSLGEFLDLTEGVQKELPNPTHILSKSDSEQAVVQTVRLGSI